MTNLYNEFHNLVKKEGFDVEDFQALISYLLSNGVLVRDDNQREEKYYDWFVRLENIVKDYFSLAGIRVFHDEDLLSVRIYAPNSDTPEDTEDVDIGEGTSSMSMSFKKGESAYLIVLALIYEQKISEGKINDMEMSVEISKEEFIISLRTFIGDLDYPKTTRMDIFRKLKKLRAIDYGDNVFDDEDNPMIVRPLIRQIILPEMLKPYIETEKKGDHNED